MNYVRNSTEPVVHVSIVHTAMNVIKAIIFNRFLFPLPQLVGACLVVLWRDVLSVIVLLSV